MFILNIIIETSKAISKYLDSGLSDICKYKIFRNQIVYIWKFKREKKSAVNHNSFMKKCIKKFLLLLK